jgi:hypothetical protein
MLPAEPQDEVMIVVGKPERTTPRPGAERDLDADRWRRRISGIAECRQREPSRYVIDVVVVHGYVSRLRAA